MSSFRMEIPWQKIIEKIVEQLTQLIAETYGEEIANQLQSNMIAEITHGEFETIHGNISIGLIAWGEYKNSIQVTDGIQRSNGDFEISVYTDDEKGEDIEWGTAPQEEADLTDQEVITWARKKKIPQPARFGKWLAQEIRDLGQAPKPVFRRSIQQLKTQNSVIKAKGLKTIKRKQASMTFS